MFLYTDRTVLWVTKLKEASPMRDYAPGSTVQLQWMDSTGMVLVSSSELTVVLQDDGSLQLMFNPLTGKHRGDYTCKATLTWATTEIESSTAQVKIASLPGFPCNEVILVESLETKPAAGNSTSEAHEPSKGAKEHTCGGTHLTKFLRYRAPSYDIMQWKSFSEVSACKKTLGKLSALSGLQTTHSVHTAT